MDAPISVRRRVISGDAGESSDRCDSWQKTLEAHRHELIKEVLRQKEAAIKVFDEKLAKLGYDGEHASKRSHHKDDADKKAPE